MVVKHIFKINKTMDSIFERTVSYHGHDITVNYVELYNGIYDSSKYEFGKLEVVTSTIFCGMTKLQRIQDAIANGELFSVKKKGTSSVLLCLGYNVELIADDTLYGNDIYKKILNSRKHAVACVHQVNYDQDSYVDNLKIIFNVLLEKR